RGLTYAAGTPLSDLQVASANSLVLSAVHICGLTSPDAPPPRPVSAEIKGTSKKPDSRFENRKRPCPKDTAVRLPRIKAMKKNRFIFPSRLFLPMPSPARFDRVHDRVAAPRKKVNPFAQTHKRRAAAGILGKRFWPFRIAR